jgi:hypothetical protein
MHLHEPLSLNRHALAGFGRGALLRFRLFTVPRFAAVLLCRWEHEELRTRDTAAPQQRSDGDYGEQRTEKRSKHCSSIMPLAGRETLNQDSCSWRATGFRPLTLPAGMDTVHPQESQHALPRSPSMPSLTIMGTITSAAAGSAHHHPSCALRRRPPRRIAERYVQNSACLASAFMAPLSMPSATFRLALATKSA